MASLMFRYGAMGSSKTANALMVRFNYLEKGMKTLMLKPMVDNRELGFEEGDGLHTISSRIGLSAPCVLVEEFLPKLDIAQSNIRNIYNKEFNLADIDCIVVDEAQFLKESDVKMLAWIVDTLQIPVICYGLRTDFRGRLFEGSAALMAMADRIEEIKTVCWCGKKASFNARVGAKGIERSGVKIKIGANSKYISLCRKHFMAGNLGSNKP